MLVFGDVPSSVVIQSTLSGNSINWRIHALNGGYIFTADALLKIKSGGDISFATGATKSLFGLDSSEIVSEKFASLALLEGLTLVFELMEMAA